MPPSGPLEDNCTDLGQPFSRDQVVMPPQLQGVS
jgi:hypothetical protein